MGEIGIVKRLSCGQARSRSLAEVKEGVGELNVGTCFCEVIGRDPCRIVEERASAASASGRCRGDASRGEGGSLSKVEGADIDGRKEGAQRLAILGGSGTGHRPSMLGRRVVL